jgi:uncharacterized Zn finger protein
MPQQTDPTASSLWARRWLATVEGFGRNYRDRLASGKALARDGRVLRVTVSPGLIEAEVQGQSYLIPHDTAIEIDPFSDEEWERALAGLAGRADYVAQLLADEMPTDIERVFAEAGAVLFPRSPDQLRHFCTCNQPGPMCTHAGAVHYVLAANLDTQPFLLFGVRGMPPEELVEHLRARWAGDGEAPLQEEPAAPPAPPEPPIAPLHAAGFYAAGPELDAFSVSIAPPQVEAALLRRLGKPPFAGKDEDPLPALTQVYSAVTRRALQALGRSGEKRRKG